MTERLDRIEANLEKLLEAVVITNQSVQTLRTEVATGFKESREYTDSAFGTLVEAMDRRDAEWTEEKRELSTSLQSLIDDGKADRAEAQQQRKETQQQRQEVSTSLQNLIDDGKADRAEAQRQRQVNAEEHQAFREQFQQLLTQLITRINDIWQRLSA